MPSDLQVSNIKDLTGSNTGLSIASDGQVTIAQNNPTVTLGSNATFPGPPTGASGGHILQIVSASYATEISKNDTNEFGITDLNITLSSTSSKVLVFGVVMGAYRGTTAGARLDVILVRRKDGADSDLNRSGANFYTLDSQNLRHGGFAIHALDSPSSTSTLTYKLNGKWSGHSNPSYVNKDGNSGNSTLTVMEIVG